jgi:hypothetical protein
MRWFEVHSAWLVMNTFRGQRTAWVALRAAQNVTHVVPFGVTSLHGWSPFDVVPSVELSDDDMPSPALWVDSHKGTKWQVVDVEVSGWRCAASISAFPHPSHASDPPAFFPAEVHRHGSPRVHL